MSIDLILDLVRNNLAIALLSADVVPADGSLRTVALTGGPTRVEHLAWSDFNPSPAGKTLLEVIDAIEPHP